VIATFPVPLTAIAFKFFEPITAPRPFLPAARLSLIIQAILLRRSPAGPMQIIRVFWSFRLSLIICWQSKVMVPHKLPASWNRTELSLMDTHVGFSAFPSTITASHPANFNSAGKYPPVSALPTAPVRGDFPTTAILLAQGIDVPVNGPGAKISLLSGPRASVPGFTSSKRYFMPSPAPPIKSFATARGSFSSCAVLLVRLTRRIFPVYPPEYISSSFYLVLLKF